MSNNGWRSWSPLSKSEAWHTSAGIRSIPRSGRCVIDPNRRERSKTFRRKVDAEKFLIQIEGTEAARRMDRSGSRGHATR